LRWHSGGSSHGRKYPVSLILIHFQESDFLFVLHVIPVYIMAQVAGGLVGAGITYGQYLQAINIYEEGGANRTTATGGLFAPFPVSDLAYTIFSYLFSQTVD
jgi:aquaglyceroporin related protein